jgi:hypothetical protein
MGQIVSPETLVLKFLTTRRVITQKEDHFRSLIVYENWTIVFTGLNSAVRRDTCLAVFCVVFCAHRRPVMARRSVQ